MTTYADFKTRIYENLGSDYHVVELSTSQFANVYRKCLKRFVEKHYDGATEQVYILPLVSGTTEYTLPNNIHSVTGYFKTSSGYGGTPTYRKLFLERNIDNVAMGSLIDYAMFTAFTTDLDIVYGYEHLFSFNKNTKKLQFMNTQGLSEIALEVWIDNSVDDSEYLHDDEFFEEYVTCKAMMQWAINLKKYNKDLLGGATINWQELESTAKEDLEKLEERLNTEYTDLYDISIC